MLAKIRFWTTQNRVNVSLNRHLCYYTKGFTRVYSSSALYSESQESILVMHFLALLHDFIADMCTKAYHNHLPSNKTCSSRAIRGLWALVAEIRAHKTHIALHCTHLLKVSLWTNMAVGVYVTFCEVKVSILCIITCISSYTIIHTQN